MKGTNGFLFFLIVDLGKKQTIELFKWCNIMV